MTRTEKIAAVRAHLSSKATYPIKQNAHGNIAHDHSRSLLLVGKTLNNRGFLAGGLLGSDGLVGGGGLSKLARAVDGGPNSFGIDPTFNPVVLRESEAQGLQKQYSLNYQRGPWNVQTGLQVGVMAQDLVDEPFFLPPPGAPSTPSVPPPVLQSPQDTFNSAVNEAYNLAFPNGFSQGFADGQVSPIMETPDFNLPVLPPGNPQGYNEGIQVGWVQGIQEGYEAGFTQARQTMSNSTVLGNSAGTGIQPFDQKFAQTLHTDLRQLLPGGSDGLVNGEPKQKPVGIFQSQELDASSGPRREEIDNALTSSEAPKVNSFSGPPSQQSNLEDIIALQTIHSPMHLEEQPQNDTFTEPSTSHADPNKKSLKVVKWAALISGEKRSLYAILTQAIISGVLNIDFYSRCSIDRYAVNWWFVTQVHKPTQNPQGSTAICGEKESRQS